MRFLLSALICLLFFISSPVFAETDPVKGLENCLNDGWTAENITINGVERQFLWKAPNGQWPKGVIFTLHGGGGHHFQWCSVRRGLTKPQGEFTKLAIEQGFAVFLLNSTDIVTDTEGRVCGKIWDDEVRDRPNLDLPYIEYLITKFIPRIRPEGSNPSVFMTGLSSGGYMSVRASTHFNNLITAFAPVSNGDPYGWHRICEEGSTIRKKVHGKGFDNETKKQITEKQSCLSETYPNEKKWNDGGAAQKPPFLALHHKKDGINDYSCHEKVVKMLRKHGYPGEVFTLNDGFRRTLWNHLWQEEYNQPILDFFTQITQQQ